MFHDTTVMKFGIFLMAFWLRIIWRIKYKLHNLIDNRVILCTIRIELVFNLYHIFYDSNSSLLSIMPTTSFSYIPIIISVVNI